MEKISALIVMILLTAVGLQVISSLNKEASESKFSLNDFYPKLDYPFCSNLESSEKVNRDEFFKTVYYRLKGECKLEEQKLESDFVLKKEELESKARKWGLEDSSGNLLVFYRENCSSAQRFDVEGLKIGQDNGEFIYHPGDIITISGIGGEITVC